MSNCRNIFFSLLMAIVLGGSSVQVSASPVPDTGVKQAVQRVESILPEPITQMSGTHQINVAGSYALTADFLGEIIINSDNVDLDLNGYRVYSGSNGIVVNANHVSISNGTIGPVTNEGVLLNTGSSFVTLKDLKINDCTTGVAATLLTDLYLDSVSASTCITGYSYTNVTNIVADDCFATANSSRGFDLQNCFLANHRRCKVMNMVGDETVIGFSSANGGSNLFEGCYAEGIMSNAVSTTQYAAGFVLSDTQSSIITDCLVNSVYAPNALAYGINTGDLTSDFLATFSYDVSTVVAFNKIVSNAVNPFVASSGLITGTAGVVNIYDISTDNFVLASSLNSIEVVKDLVWSPDGSFIAVATSNTSTFGSLDVYSVNGSGIISVSPVATFTFAYEPLSIDWSKTGSYIAVVSTDLLHAPNTTVIQVLQFNGVLLSLVDTLYPAYNGAAKVSWAVDVDKLLVTTPAVHIVPFDGSTLKTGFYFPVSGSGIIGTFSPVSEEQHALRLIMAYNTAEVLAKLVGNVSYDDAGRTPSLISVAAVSGVTTNLPFVACNNPSLPRWSHDGKNIASTGYYLQGANPCQVLAAGGNFSRTLQQDVPAAFVYDVAWNYLDNRFVVVGQAGDDLVSTGGGLWLYSFDQHATCTNCVIKNNVIDDVHGLVQGTGIAGVSFVNSVASNQVAHCDTDYSVGVNNVYGGFASQTWPLSNESL